MGNGADDTGGLADDDGRRLDGAVDLARDVNRIRRDWTAHNRTLANVNGPADDSSLNPAIDLDRACAADLAEDGQIRLSSQNLFV